MFSTYYSKYMCDKARPNNTTELLPGEKVKAVLMEVFDRG
jgi:hypothetical protein